MTRSYVVTGGGRGVGRAIAERLATHGQVIALDRDGDALAWTTSARNVEGVAGDAMDEETLASVALRAAQTGTLTGWVNNAAVFRDAALPDTPLAEVMALVTTNLGLAVAGSAAAVRCFLADGTPRRDRQCLVSSGPARGARGAALRHRQGRH